MYVTQQRIMRPFIDQNQRLAETVLKRMIPGSKLQLQLQNFMFRLHLKFPGNERMFRGK